MVATLEDDRPSGLDWLPDGGLLAVAMASRQLRRVDPGRPTPRTLPIGLLLVDLGEGLVFRRDIGAMATG